MLSDIYKRLPSNNFFKKQNSRSEALNLMLNNIACNDFKGKTNREYLVEKFTFYLLI